MDQTPALSHFDEFYVKQRPAVGDWRTQPAIVEVERAGLIRGKVLDVGCGTGADEPAWLATARHIPDGRRAAGA